MFLDAGDRVRLNELTCSIYEAGLMPTILVITTLTPDNWVHWVTTKSVLSQLVKASVQLRDSRGSLGQSGIYLSIGIYIINSINVIEGNRHGDAGHIQESAALLYTTKYFFLSFFLAFPRYIIVKCNVVTFIGMIFVYLVLYKFWSNFGRAIPRALFHIYCK